MLSLPFKLNQDRRRHISKQKRRVTNSAAYDAALRQRGSLTIWFTDKAVAAWKASPRTTAGGQPWYFPLAILTALTLRAVFHVALRQTASAAPLAYTAAETPTHPQSRGKAKPAIADVRVPARSREHGEP